MEEKKNMKLVGTEEEVAPKQFTEDEVRVIIQNNMNQFVNSYKCTVERVGLLMAIVNSNNDLYSKEFKEYAAKEVESFFMLEDQKEDNDNE